MRMMLNERRDKFQGRQERRRPTNVSLDAALVDEAKALGINISKACDDGLAAANKQERERRWLEENAGAIKTEHDYTNEKKKELKYKTVDNYNSSYEHTHHARRTRNLRTSWNTYTHKTSLERRTRLEIEKAKSLSTF